MNHGQQQLNSNFQLQAQQHPLELGGTDSQQQHLQQQMTTAQQQRMLKLEHIQQHESNVPPNSNCTSGSNQNVSPDTSTGNNGGDLNNSNASGNYAQSGGAGNGQVHSTSLDGVSETGESQ